MSRAIGMIEFKTTPAGITAADAMVKTSEVEIVEAQTVCPGKYIAIITGDLSAVKAAVDTAVTTYEDKCIDSFVLGNPHESISQRSTEPHRLRRSVPWESWRPMMRHPSSKQQIRLQRQQSLI